MNRKIAILRSVINAVYREYRWLKGEPPLFRGLPGAPHRERALSPSEVLRLSEAFGDRGDLVLMSVARQANILKLRIDQINLADRTIVFPGEIMKNGDPLRIPINEMALAVIMRWKDNGTEWLFPLLNRKKPLNGIPSKQWQAACKKAGLKSVRWHDLRHTWATLMRRAKVSLDALQRLGGWRDRRMVDRYAHINVSDLAPHSAAIDGVFAPVGAQQMRSAN